MTIRKAFSYESKEVAPLLLLAMEDIVYDFIGVNSKSKALSFLDSMIKDSNNQYSYENCYVVESKSKIVAAAVVYKGDDLHKLRKPVATRIKDMFGKEFFPEDEAEDGEFYIDSVGVDEAIQGKGIGSKLFKFLIDEYVHRRNETLGLLVDKNNPNAKMLYLNIGFKPVGEKSIGGKFLEHLQYSKEN